MIGFKIIIGILVTFIVAVVISSIPEDTCTKEQEVTRFKWEADCMMHSGKGFECWRKSYQFNCPQEDE